MVTLDRDEILAALDELVQVLVDDWLNDKVKAFASHFDGPEDWMAFDVREGVEVRIAAAPLLLAMKLRAARGRRDSADIDLLLDACEITTAEAAVAVFERYYPEELLPPRARAQLAARFPQRPGREALGNQLLTSDDEIVELVFAWSIFNWDNKFNITPQMNANDKSGHPKAPGCAGSHARPSPPRRARR